MHLPTFAERHWVLTALTALVVLVVAGLLVGMVVGTLGVHLVSGVVAHVEPGG